MALKFSCESPDSASLNIAQQALDIPEVALPVTCGGDVASLGFDISTFDGLEYSSHGEGEFVLTKSQDSLFELQGRFVNYHPSKLSSALRGFAIRDTDVPTVQINVGSATTHKFKAWNGDEDILMDGHCPIDLYVDGKYHEFDGEYSLSNVRVERLGEAGETVVVYYPQTGVQVTALVKESSWHGCYLAIKLCLPDYFRPEEDLVGLFGTRDNDITNDWMNREGKQVSIEMKGIKSKGGFSYSKTWCIEDDEDSLFAYGDNESFESISNCKLAFNDDIDTCMRQPSPEMSSLCGSTSSCLSAGCSGDIQDSIDAVNIDNDLLERRCGDLISFEDFNDGNLEDDSGWKEVRDGKLIPAQRARNAILGNNQFLGRLSRDHPLVMKKYIVPKTANSITIEFEFFELDNWAGDGGRDTLFITLNDHRIDLGVFDEPCETMYQKIQDGISVRRQSLAQPSNMGFNQEFLDQAHRIVIDVPQRIYQQGVLKVVFEADLSLSELMESAGIDNFRMTAHRKNCRVIWTGGELPVGKPQLPTARAMKETKATKNRKNKNRKLGKENRKPINGPKKSKSDSVDALFHEKCRVGYAFHSRRVSTKFEDMGFTGHFGWSNGPFADSNFAYTFDIKTEASLSHDGGTVGSMTVDYDGSEAVLSVDLSSGKLYPKDIHAFIGTSRLPKQDMQDVIDPSQFPIVYEPKSAGIDNQDKNQMTFVISGFDHDAIFIVAHMTICGDFSAPTIDGEGQSNPGFRGVDSAENDQENEDSDDPTDEQSKTAARKLYESAFAKIRKLGF